MIPFCCCNCCSSKMIKKITKTSFGYTGSGNVFTADLGYIPYLSNVPSPEYSETIEYIPYVDGSPLPSNSISGTSEELDVFYTVALRHGYDARYEYYLRESVIEISYYLVENA